MRSRSYRPSCVRRGRHATRLLALAMAIVVAPGALAAPGDITQIAAPTLGADPPKAQNISDGDVSVATQTGQLSYSYPVTLPPARHGMAPSLSLTYSSQAAIYGGIAAGWQLEIPSIRWDPSKSRLRYWDEADILNGNNDPFISTLSGGRPLVKVTEPHEANVHLTYRAQNEGL